MMSTGRKSIAFMNTTHTPTVSASGATTFRSPWKMPLHCSLPKSINSSTKACVFDGTPAVALRVTDHMKPNATTPSTIDVTTVSTLTRQKPPASLAVVRNVRWCWMYDVGVSAVSAAIPGSLLPTLFADEKRHAEHDDGDHESREERDDHDVVVDRQRNPQAAGDQHDLAGLGTQHRDERRSRARDLRTAKTEPEDQRVAEPRHHVDRAPERRRQCPVPTGYEPGDQRDRGRGDQLPLEDGADRLGLERGSQTRARCGRTLRAAPAKSNPRI